MDTKTLRVSGEAQLVARAILALESGEAVRLRQRLGLSQALIAQAIGCEPPTVSRWESRNRRPHGQLAIRYGRLLADLQRLEKDDGSEPTEPLADGNADAPATSLKA
jgi:DNA-binding transcriptional regulator YiaG